RSSTLAAGLCQGNKIPNGLPIRACVSPWINSRGQRHMTGAPQRETLLAISELLLCIVPFIIDSTNQGPFHRIAFVFRHLAAPEIFCLSGRIRQSRVAVLLVTNVTFSTRRDMSYS